MSEYYKLKKATAPKKWQVLVPTDSGRGRTVKFGATGYQDYTQHKDKQRRENYRSRHRNDNLDDPKSAGFWSWYVLWGESTDIKKNFASAVARAKRLGYKSNPVYKEKHPDLFESEDTPMSIPPESEDEVILVEELEEKIEELVEKITDTAKKWQQDQEEKFDEDRAEDEISNLFEAHFEPKIEHDDDYKEKVVEKIVNENDLVGDILNKAWGIFSKEQIFTIIEDLSNYEGHTGIADGTAVFEKYMEDENVIYDWELSDISDFQDEVEELIEIYKMVDEQGLADEVDPDEGSVVRDIENGSNYTIGGKDLDDLKISIVVSYWFYVTLEEEGMLIDLKSLVEDEITDIEEELEEDEYVEDPEPPDPLQVEKLNELRSLLEDIDKALNEIVAVREAPAEQLIYTFPDQFENFEIIRLTNKDALVQEGRALGHCVANYWGSVRSGRIAILSVRTPAGKRRFTIEATLDDTVPDTSLIPKIKHIDQIKGKANRQPGFSNAQQTGKFKPFEVLMLSYWVQEVLGKDPWEVSDLRPGLSKLYGSEGEREDNPEPIEAVHCCWCTDCWEIEDA